MYKRNSKFSLAMYITYIPITYYLSTINRLQIRGKQYRFGFQAYYSINNLIN